MRSLSRGMVTFGLTELIIIAAQHLFSQTNKSLNENLFEFSIVVLKSFESWLSYSSTLEHKQLTKLIQNLLFTITLSVLYLQDIGHCDKKTL